MSRVCAKCPTSRMRDQVRHLHELEPGQSFRFTDRPEVLRVVDVNDTSCKIASAPTTTRRRITPRFGEPREFDVTTTGVRPCAPCAQVEPVA